MTWAVKEFVRKNVGENQFKSKLRDFLLSVYSTLENPETLYVLDKTPRYYEIATEILTFFPHAKFIVLKRNPFAVVNSILTTWQTNTLEKLCLYKADLLSAPMLIHEFLRENASTTNILEVHYEELVSEPSKSFRQIYEWLDLPFREEFLDYSENDKFRGSLGDQVGIKKHQRAISQDQNKWKLLMDRPFWGNWVRGYSGYLGEKWLGEYGSYEPIFNKITEEFRYYLFLCSKQKERAYVPVSELKGIIKYSYYRARFGSPRKEW
jgi:hypothetical protein